MKTKIESEIKVLMPKLIERFQRESGINIKVVSNSSFKILNINNNKGSRAAPFTDNENIKYRQVLCFMYFMSLLNIHPLILTQF